MLNKIIDFYNLKVFGLLNVSSIEIDSTVSKKNKATYI